MKSLISLKNYKFPKDKLLLNAEKLNFTKRDLRKKTLKFNTKDSDLKRIIKKNQNGGFLEYNILLDDHPIYESYEPNKSENLNFSTPMLYPSLFPGYNIETTLSNNTNLKSKTKVNQKNEDDKNKSEDKLKTEEINNPFDNTYGYMKVIIDSALKEGVPLQVTSGYRPGSKTSNGSESWHSKGHAIDIIPAKGISWEEFKNKLYNTTNTLKLMKKLGYGILDETTPEMLAKTGGTGAHLHIGKDKLALENFYKLFPHLKKGGLIPKAQEGKKFKLTQYWGTPMVDYYVVKPGDNFNEIQNELETDSLQQYNNIKDTNKIYVGDTLYYRNEPSFFDNFYRFWMESPELSKKNMSLNEQIERNIQKNKQRIQTFNTPNNYNIKFKTKDFKNFAETMTKIYTEVLNELGLPTHNVNNLVKQDALESDYGLKPKGNGFNLGGIRVFTNKEKLGTQSTDGHWYRNFKDLKDYATYKVKLLHNYYGAITAPSDKFIDILHGENPSNKYYNDDKSKYTNTFNNMKSLNNYLK